VDEGFLVFDAQAVVDLSGFSHVHGNRWIEHRLVDLDEAVPRVLLPFLLDLSFNLLFSFRGQLFPVGFIDRGLEML